MNAQDATTAAAIFGEPIYSYTRAQALEDGYLVDVSETAREAGFQVPVALTRAAWEDCVAWDDKDTERKHWPQDETGRLWDVLSMTRFYLRVATRRNPDCDRAQVILARVPREGSDCNARHVTVTVVIGPSHEGTPVVTIGLPDDF